jgi:hypothetical protein
VLPRLRSLAERSIELCTAAVLSVAAFGTSWSGYQATLWNGTQDRLGLFATANQTCATRAAASHANNVSDNYMLATVVFAVVLFFARGVQDARSRDVRIGMLLIAALAVAAGFGHVIRLPHGAS